MRVVNDRNDKAQEPNQLGLLTVPLYVVICALGVSTLFLSPFAMILAHLRLPNYWPKIAAIGGAVIALIFFSVPVPAVLLSFVFGVFVADNVQRQVPFWQLLFRSFVLIAFLGLVAIALLAPGHGGDLGRVWHGLVNEAITQVQNSGLMAQEADWDSLRETLLYEGAFFFVGACLLSLWVSIGLCAHLSWVDSSHLYSAESLRKLSLPSWAGAVFIGLWVGKALIAGPQGHLISGLASLSSILMFIQGSMTLSLFLEAKGFSRVSRTVIFVLLTGLGFYAVVTLGVLSYWLVSRKKPLFHSQNLEEAI